MFVIPACKQTDAVVLFSASNPTVNMTADMVMKDKGKQDTSKESRCVDPNRQEK